MNRSQPEGNSSPPSTAGGAVPAIDIAELRHRHRALPLRPYEFLVDGDRAAAENPGRAEEIVRQGWIKGNFAPVMLEPPIAWEEICAENRMWEFELQSWNPLGPLLGAYQGDPSGRAHLLDIAVQVALDWIARYPDVDSPSRFAWYDMAVGVRAYRLGFILDAALRSGYEDEAISALVRSAILHCETLSNEGVFAAHSNHGFYVAAGQLSLASRFSTLPSMAHSVEQGRTRLRELTEAHFTSEGVHREHSPDYHRRMLNAIGALIDSGTVDSDEFDRLRARLEEAMSWFILPNGRLAAFGDSSPIDMTSSEQRVARTPQLRFVASCGEEGSAPRERLRAFPESGYAVVRDAPVGREGDGLQSYLAQACAFHSRTHKLADDLAFIWFDRGHELVVEPGRFGYLGRTDPESELAKAGFWYSDPRRVYVESTRAHNTVEIDDRSHERRGVKPYGSALRRLGTADGVHFIESEVRHRRSIRHARVLLLHPGSWLVVFDWLWDNLKQPHAFSQRFHFSPALNAALGDGYVCMHKEALAEPLYVVPLLDSQLTEPARGQKEPELLGWVSPRNHHMTPTWTVAFRAEGVPSHTFVTLLSLAESAPVPALARNAVAESGRSARLEWRSGRSTHRLALSRPSDGDIELSYRRIPAERAL